MREITRRAALRGTAAVATCAVAGTAAIAAMSDEDPALQAAAEWHERWSRMLDFERYLEKHPEVYDDSDLWHASKGPKIGQAYSDTRKRLVAAEPMTVAGAVALLGCASTIFETRELARNDFSAVGTHARRMMCLWTCHGETEMVRNAHGALARLVGEG